MLMTVVVSDNIVSIWVSGYQNCMQIYLSNLIQAMSLMMDKIHCHWHRGCLWNPKILNSLGILHHLNSNESLKVVIKVWISRCRIFCARTQGSNICTSISLKWSYQPHRVILYLMPLCMTLFGLKTAMWLIAPFQRYWSTNPGSLRLEAKDHGLWD